VAWTGSSYALGLGVRAGIPVDGPGAPWLSWSYNVPEAVLCVAGCSGSGCDPGCSDAREYHALTAGFTHWREHSAAVRSYIGVGGGWWASSSDAGLIGEVVSGLGLEVAPYLMPQLELRFTAAAGIGAVMLGGVGLRVTLPRP
jgi:hypothetical protein